MSHDDATADHTAVRVRRVDDRLGLAVLRAGLSARTLVTYARDHVTVRTPSRPDFADGNTLDLVAPPGAADVDTWVARYERTIATMGAPHTRVRWEDTPGAVPDATLLAAFAQRGFAIEARGVALLDHLVVRPPAPDVEIAPVAAPSHGPVAADDRRWHAATVLYRYARGDGPDDFRDFDPRAAQWIVEVHRELATAMRATVWVAMRHGAPVARCTVAHDRQGLAVVEDVIVHPVHRRSGIATGLVQQAVHQHLEREPDTRVGVAHPLTAAAERLVAGLGFRAHATVFTAHRD